MANSTTQTPLCGHCGRPIDNTFDLERWGFMRDDGSLEQMTGHRACFHPERKRRIAQQLAEMEKGER